LSVWGAFLGLALALGGNLEVEPVDSALKVEAEVEASPVEVKAPFLGRPLGLAAAVEASPRAIRAASWTSLSVQMDSPNRRRKEGNFREMWSYKGVKTKVRGGMKDEAIGRVDQLVAFLNIESTCSMSK